MTRSWIFLVALSVLCMGAIDRVVLTLGSRAARASDDMLAVGSATVLLALLLEFWRSRRPRTVRGAVDRAWRATKARRDAVRELAGLLPNVVDEDAHERFVDLRGIAWSAREGRLVIMGTTRELHALATHDGITFARSDTSVFALDPLLHVEGDDDATERT